MLLDIGIGMEGDRRKIVDALLRLLIEGLDIAQSVLELQPRHPDLVGRQPVKHECIVGVRAVGHRNGADLSCGSAGHRLAGATGVSSAVEGLGGVRENVPAFAPVIVMPKLQECYAVEPSRENLGSLLASPAAASTLITSANRNG